MYKLSVLNLGLDNFKVMTIMIIMLIAFDIILLVTLIWNCPRTTLQKKHLGPCNINTKNSQIQESYDILSMISQHDMLKNIFTSDSNFDGSVVRRKKNG